MKRDLGETTNALAENRVLAKQLSEKLFAMLDEMGACFPTREPNWTAEKEKAFLQNVIDKRWPRLEKQRMEFLSEDFNPKNNWWGSRVQD